MSGGNIHILMLILYSSIKIKTKSLRKKTKNVLVWPNCPALPAPGSVDSPCLSNLSQHIKDGRQTKQGQKSGKGPLDDDHLKKWDSWRCSQPCPW